MARTALPSNLSDTSINKKARSGRAFLFMAVREGFEPSKPCDLHTFQACSFDHSDTSPIKSYCLLLYYERSLRAARRCVHVIALRALSSVKPSSRPLGHLTNKIVLSVVYYERSLWTARRCVHVIALRALSSVKPSSRPLGHLTKMM